MRKFFKNQLIDLISSIYEALKLCKNTKNVNILAECQDAVSVIGSTVAESEGENSLIIDTLVDFNELLFKASIAIENDKDFNKSLNLCKDKLKLIEHEIKKLSLTYEVLFMPYKASMWDALNSVYREAIKAENCHVTVMPAPYYNINPQGQKLSLEYEGDIFPEDIEITHYDNYNIPNIKPDVIFIHNPYDEYNLVTRLPQSLYSTELVKHTEKLVYIPYFITNGTSVREGYCNLPAPVYSWRTFVQSEAVREVYCKYSSKEKTVALGSPKLDMVVKYDKEKPVLPEEWENALKNKKVFFYNTHLRNIIGEAEKTIKKLNWVFSLFENREDIALLWRPHPLSIQTAKSLSPQILNSYIDLIDRFKKQKIGIYDDTDDLHRAIAVSDAYIGDFSSVLHLYRLTGKPVFIMSCPNISSEDPFDYLLADTGVTVDGYIYTFSNDYNALFKIKNNNVEFICKLEEEPNFYRVMFGSALKYNDDIIFLPALSKYIVRYNTKTNVTKYFKTKYADGYSRCTNGAYIWNDYLYTPLTQKNDVLKINLKDNTVKSFETILKKDENLSDCSFYATKQKENLLFIACNNKNKFIIWNMLDDTYSVVNVPIEANGIYDIAIDENNCFYFLSQSKKDIFRWDIEKNEINCILKLSNAEKIHAYKNKLFLIPGKSEKICVIDLKTLSQTELEYPENFRFLNTYKIFGAKYSTYELENNVLKLFPRNANMYLEIDMDTCKINGYTWHLPDEFKTSEFKETHRVNNDYNYLEGRITLEEFINSIDKDPYKEQRKQLFMQNNKNTDGTAGKKIWDYIYKFL